MTVLPTISVGLPVYNGERFLERAIDSVLAQSFQDWELLISDNGSTDRTAEIAASYAARDPRIRSRAFQDNQGAVANFDVVFRETSAPFFMWLAHDDWLDPSYLTTCDRLLESNEQAVLAFTGMHVVDESGEPFRDRHEPFVNVDSDNPLLRFHDVLWRLQDPTSSVFGLARRSALERTGLIRNSNEPDRILLAELSLLGTIHQDASRLFYHHGPPGHTDRDNWLWLNPRNRGRKRFATPRIIRHQGTAVWKSDHALWQKVVMTVDLLVASMILRLLGKSRAVFKQIVRTRRLRKMRSD